MKCGKKVKTCLETNLKKKKISFEHQYKPPHHQIFKSEVLRHDIWRMNDHLLKGDKERLLCGVFNARLSKISEIYTRIPD
jgi:hypothetical protein